jgi:hypothetical protein
VEFELPKDATTTLSQPGLVQGDPVTETRSRAQSFRAKCHVDTDAGHGASADVYRLHYGLSFCRARYYNWPQVTM